VHLPFVHRSTIGRGLGKVIDGPKVRLSYVSDTLEERFCNFYRKEDGTAAKKPDEFEYDESSEIIHFRFPHLWQNRLLEKMRVFIAFVPIDDENCVLYMRYYQRFVTIPLLKQLVCAIGRRFSKVILYQDKCVVITQEPKKTDYKMKENLITGDLPIVYYRRIRSELQENNGNFEQLKEKEKD
jgi:phenylpropionate dioxygenase-like ring-hydroxylating dioxygenase large terminal subunit